MAKKKDDEAVPAVLQDGNKLPAALAEQMEAAAGKGMEGTDQSCFAIPFLRIIQSNSPQLDSADGEYIAEAKIGMLFNTVTKELFDGEKGVLVIPAAFKKSYVEWGSRDDGGGFKGEHPAESDILTQTDRNEKGQDELPNGNIIQDTRSHYCMMVHPTTGMLVPIVIAMASTQIKKSRQWLTQMRQVQVPGKQGPYNPPTYSQVSRVTTIPEENAKGKWRGFKFTLEGFVSDAGAYTEAEGFHKQVVGDKVRAAYESVSDGVASPGDGEEAF